MLIEVINRAERAVEARLSVADRGAAAPADSRRGHPEAAGLTTPVKYQYLLRRAS